MSTALSTLAATAAQAASGSVEIGGIFSDVVFVVFVLTAIAGTVLAIARPWELLGGRFVDKIRVGEAVSSYDFWLGLRGVTSRRRRELRAELRANLWDATQRVGAKEAIAAVGPLRTLAYDSVPERTGPRWGYGVAAGFVALQFFLMGQVLLTTVVVDTAEAAHASRLDVAVTLVPGMTVQYEDTVAGGFSFGASFGPACLVVGLVTFVLVSQPWRLLHRRSAVPA
ncbi:hypothetical protein [Kineosporia sp. A_224]|uniref:hypothetical protein n=1 Tax=Kineosporia sp. A_224 TaxID=1962180 RepID=UPI000B4A5B74|nr:hypothetical protein [Kineosporia sp. A_224]